MKVFISWSGETSKAVAEALRDWIPSVIQAVKDPFLSAADIDAGARWSEQITEKLKDTKFGIICLIPDNIESPWIHFEAGALSKTVDDRTRVCPYLFGMETTDVKWPLAQFQAVKAEVEGTRKLMHSINRALGEEKLPEEGLDAIFDTFWPQLKDRLDTVSHGQSQAPPVREPREMLEEVLQLVRDLTNRPWWAPATVYGLGGFGSIDVDAPGASPNSAFAGLGGLSRRKLVPLSTVLVASPTAVERKAHVPRKDRGKPKAGGANEGDPTA